MYNKNSIDVKVEFDRGQEPFWEVIDPDTGEVSYFKISQIYGVEVKEGPKEGDIVIKEEKIEEKKKRGLRREVPGLFEEVAWIDDSDWKEAVDKFSQVGEVYPITSKELEETLNLAKYNWGDIYGE